MLTLRDLIEQPPLIHKDRTITWGICPALAHVLDDAVGPASITRETGCGLSTLVILREQPRQHTAVQPVPDEFAAILQFADGYGMDIRSFRPIVARSQDWLPRADLPDLDLVLVAGAHAFPVPFLDGYYGAEKLKVGGVMVVDLILAHAVLHHVINLEHLFGQVAAGLADGGIFHLVDVAGQNRKLIVRSGALQPLEIWGVYHPRTAR